MLNMASVDSQSGNLVAIRGVDLTQELSPTLHTPMIGPYLAPYLGTTQRGGLKLGAVGESRTFTSRDGHEV